MEYIILGLCLFFGLYVPLILYGLSICCFHSQDDPFSDYKQKMKNGFWIKNCNNWHFFIKIDDVIYKDGLPLIS